MQEGTWQKLVWRMALVLCTASCLLALSLTYRYVHGKQQMVQTARSHTKHVVTEIAKTINAKLDSIRSIVNAMADDLSADRLTHEELLEQLQHTFEKEELLASQVGVAYVPRGPDGVLYAPHYGTLKGEAQFFQVEQLYDYTAFSWYTHTIAHGQNWIEPYFREATQEFMAGFCTSFSRADVERPRPDGVVRFIFSLANARELVASPVLGKTGYGFLLSQKMTFIAHPIQAYLGKNIADVAEQDDMLRAISQRQDTVQQASTGQTAWIFYETIPVANWTMGIVFNPQEVFDNTTIFRQQQYWIVISVLAGLFGLALLVCRVDQGSLPALWASGISAAVLCCIGIGSIWYLTVTTASDDAYQHHTVVVDAAGTEAALHNLLPPHSQQREDFDRHPPFHVPTGAFVQSIEFTSANNVRVTGYVWQKYVNGIPEKFMPGVVLPEAVSLDITQAYQGEGVIGWYFAATLRQQFAYAQYPFDRQAVWIRLWPKDFFSNTVLVPDFAAYRNMQPELKPGLEFDFVLGDWEIQNSFFSYKNIKYNTYFRSGGHRGEAYPEFYFNVGLLRNFMRPFITEMVPLVVVSLLLFSVLFISTGNAERMGVLGFSASAVLGYCAALFFVLIVKHSQLRSTLAVHGIVYIEYFYFVMYLAILVVSLNSLLLASDGTMPLIHYKDNLLVKILYWPVILGILLIVTLCVFY